MTIQTRWTLPLALAALSTQGTALSNQNSSVSVSSRRSFLTKAPLVAASFGAGMLLRHDDACGGCARCSCGFGPAPAFAYERRDVGGADRSPEQAAFNEQAYQTNQRLERNGFKLDTQAEQSASLTAALSDYSYGATTTKSSKNKKDGKKNSK